MRKWQWRCQRGLLLTRSQFSVGTTRSASRHRHPVVNLEQEFAKIAGAKAYCTLGMLEGYRKGPLDDASQGLFTFVLENGQFTPTRVLNRVMNATSCSQGPMLGILMVGKICLVDVDDVVVSGRTARELTVNVVLLVA